MVTWLAVDGNGRLAAFEIGEFGARPAWALRLDAVAPEHRAGWWDEDGSALLRFAHVASQPGGIYARAGGAGTARIDDVPDEICGALQAISFAHDLTATDVIDLVKALPETLLLGQEVDPDGVVSPLELPGLFETSGTRVRLGRPRRKPDGDDES